METMNGTPEQNNSQGFGAKEMCISAALGQPEKITAYNTCQVKNYDHYELAGFSAEAKLNWRENNWEKDLNNAYEAGKRMAETV